MVNLSTRLEISRKAARRCLTCSTGVSYGLVLSLKGAVTYHRACNRCLTVTRKGEIPEAFKPIYDVLIGIRNDLDKLSLTQAWSLRETDLYDFQRQLDKIDEARVNGNWLDDQGQPAELYVQRVSAVRTISCEGTLMLARPVCILFEGVTATSIR